ncbi:choice-of-anchor H family protein [Pseudoalteromonas sp. C2R02]|uniref:choice-of-anchor H family protein n=1 Tax=Pseudoalteromonas sp. C2R02 TaxID=2841565 RepID=UPI001C089DE1|nr:choice-of-anchor H family protein [Pseudoalteromonas sp. C2R02]MBU2967833.1 choice-of-anchor H family protein [Pseudoalteromonas sp. C2R02]
MRLFTVTLLIAVLSSFTASAEILTKASPSIKVQQSVKKQNAVKSAVKNSVMNHQEPIWFYDVTSEAYQDLDQDGYFQNLALNFDLDTDYSSLDVFVDIAFINQNGISELVYTSDLFTLNGDSDKDNQQFDFQFFDLLPTNYYQVYITVRDAYSSEVYLTANHNDFYALEDLPLEGSVYDQDNELSIYSLAIQYHQDIDNDQYYENFTLAIDADTTYGYQNVVADIVIDGQLFYSSNAFTIYADSTEDKQYFDINLQSGFVSGYYDIEVVLRDADYGHELHYISSNSWANLAGLALESKEYVQEEYVEVVHSSGSAAYMLLALVGFTFYRRK